MSNTLPSDHALPFFSELDIQFHISGGDEITNRFCSCLEKELKRVERRTKGGILVITIEQCSKGGRWARMCCAELGMGLIRINMRWELKDSKGGAALVSGECHLKDSGNIGFSDLCESKYGETTLFGKLMDEAVTKISNSIADVPSH